MTSERSLKGGQAEWGDFPAGGGQCEQTWVTVSTVPSTIPVMSLRPNKYLRKEGGRRGGGGKKGGGRGEEGREGEGEGEEGREGERRKEGGREGG